MLLPYRLMILTSVFLILNFLSCRSVKLICTRQYNIGSWLTFHHQNESASPFILKCREDISKTDKVGPQLPSQITIVNNLEEWMSKCNRLSCILSGLKYQPKQHLLANGLVILKWILKKILDEIIDYIFQHFLQAGQQPSADLLSNVTEKLSLKFE